jgi:hypothetical protein
MNSEMRDLAERMCALIEGEGPNPTRWFTLREYAKRMRKLLAHPEKDDG